MMPMLRIDYIFHDKALKPFEHRTINKDYSDHYPVVARFLLPE
jgi:endonuclease/exonuclease/phosphatase (EEP) superfamily protein YafD